MSATLAGMGSLESARRWYEGMSRAEQARLNLWAAANPMPADMHVLWCYFAMPLSALWEHPVPGLAAAESRATDDASLQRLADAAEGGAE